MSRESEKRLAIVVAVIGFSTTSLGVLPAAAGPASAPGKADKLSVPLDPQPPEDYPVAAGGKEDRGPVSPETTKRKLFPKSNRRLSADDRLTPDPPDPDRLFPE